MVFSLCLKCCFSSFLTCTCSFSLKSQCSAAIKTSAHACLQMTGIIVRCYVVDDPILWLTNSLPCYCNRLCYFRVMHWKYRLVCVLDWVSTWLTQLSSLGRRFPTPIIYSLWWPYTSSLDSIFLSLNFQNVLQRTFACTLLHHPCLSSIQWSILWLSLHTSRFSSGQHLHTLAHIRFTGPVSSHVFAALVIWCQVSSSQQI